MKMVRQTPIAAAVSLTLLSAVFAAQAQQADQAAKKAEASQLDQVVITGIRASLETAANIKKNASAVVDAVSAEDVGKLPDADVGQALGRIPGISIGRAFGQGSSVSIRGTDPQMTYTTLNGQTVASTGWYDQNDIDRSFNYSLLPAELIGGMEVYKSSQANLTEGGIGGTVIVKTRKPLDLAAHTAFATVRYGDGTISEPEKDVSGLYSWRNEGRTLGVLVAGGTSRGNYIRRGIEADSRWSSDVAPTTFLQERKRDALNVALQARPIQGLEVGLSLLNMKLSADSSNTSHYLFHGPNCTKRNPAVKSTFNPDGICLSSTTTAANPLPNSFLQVWARAAEMSSDSVSFDAHYTLDKAKFDFVMGSTKAKGGTSVTSNYQTRSWTDPSDPVGFEYFKPPAWQGTIDATGKQIVVSPTADPSFNLSHMPKKMGPQDWAALAGPNRDKEQYAQLDGTFDLNWGAISVFKTGVRFADHTFEKRGYRPRWNATMVPADTSSLFNGSVQVASWHVPRPNIGAMINNTQQNVETWIENRAAYGELNEKNRSAYGMFEFDTQDVRGNFGLRYISTTITSTGYKFDGSPLQPGDYAGNINWGRSLAVTTAKYNDVLPSVNIAFDLKRNLVLRMTASQAITRPNFAEMFGVTVSGYDDDRTQNETWTVGNVKLKPMKSSQADLSLEYYYGRGNMLSATFFTKDISNFVTAEVKENQKVGLVDPLSGVDNWTVQSFVNSGGGRIRGLELQANHAFGNGFGVSGNYTFTEGKAPGSSYLDKLGVFTQASKHNVNLVGYYETQDYFARAAYNWRSKYMIREGAYWFGNRMHDAFGTLDASLGWNITKNLKLSLDFINLLKEDDVQYGAAAASNTAVKDPLRAGFPAWSAKGETTYKLGLSAKF
ncbi:TonB-dependent receptor [Paucibacter sp. XJ19-41]|uniref:TonB-dependent receptor n=1 Tax=Paucibacter sp. XJ19-41 TaxID=2927824 RepID=UPI00234BD167|nr:TonB-dependent receptor [Paucibacter sp. XJ19-41]MDC6168299.1 TonB-dependent receptor [Paucibacter sp. XJ19-41]